MDVNFGCKFLKLVISSIFWKFKADFFFKASVLLGDTRLG